VISTTTVSATEAAASTAATTVSTAEAAASASTAATAKAAASTAAASTTIFAWTGLIDPQRTTFNLGIVQCINSSLSCGGIFHLHKTKPLGPIGLAVKNHFGGLDATKFGKQ
jgi:hypothetical protein